MASAMFIDSAQNLGDSQSIGLALDDVDRDRDLDAFVANADGQANKVWFNLGTDGNPCVAPLILLLLP